jgi:hypothetical protein
VESGGRFCVDVFVRNEASVAVKMFSHLIYLIKKCYKFCSFDAICKDSAAIDGYCSTQKGFIPVNNDASFYNKYLLHCNWSRVWSRLSLPVL